MDTHAVEYHSALKRRDVLRQCKQLLRTLYGVE